MKHKVDAITFANKIIDKHISTGLNREQANNSALITIEFILETASRNYEYSLYQRTYNYFAEVIFNIPIELRHRSVNRPKDNNVANDIETMSWQKILNKIKTNKND